MLLGDGFSTVLHCENADDRDLELVESDAGPVLCRESRGDHPEGAEGRLRG